MSRWIFAVQAGLFCVTDSGSIVVLCQTEQAEVAIWGGKGGGIFFSLFCTLRIQNDSVMQSSLSLKVTVLQKHKNSL